MHNAGDYAAMLAGLLPRGIIWRGGPRLNALLGACAEELARLEGAAHRLIREVTPQTAVEALEDWEAELGLPDPCLGAAGTIQQRREAVLRKLQRGGGQNEAYYLDLARALGYPGARVDGVREFRAGVSRAGHRVWAEAWHHVFFVTVPLHGDVREFRAGSSRAGDRLRLWGDEALECVMRREKPAHTNVIVQYQED